MNRFDPHVLTSKGVDSDLDKDTRGTQGKGSPGRSPRWAPKGLAPDPAHKQLPDLKPKCSKVQPVNVHKAVLDSLSLSFLTSQ